MGLRAVMRWIAVGAPYAWFGFATHFRASQDVVGADFFRRFAEAVHANFEGRGTDAGLMDSFDALKSETFDPAKVHPLIREFYEHTSRFDLDVTITWHPLLRPFGYLYQRLIARQMQQLIIPLSDEELTGLDSWLELIDLDFDQRPDFRCWIRVGKQSRLPVYIGAYRTYASRIDNRPRTYVSVAFPLPGGSMTTVLSPLNWQTDGFVLTTRDPTSTENGVYLLRPHAASFSMLPAFGLSERFELRAVAAGIEVTHSCYLLGLTAFEMQYHITPTRKRSAAELAPFFQTARVGPA